MKLPDEIYRMFAEMEADNNRRTADAAAADPKRYRLCRVMARSGSKGGLNHRYWPAGKSRSARYWFCVSNFVNAAGYFLIWREVQYLKPRKTKRDGTLTGKRDQWAARKSATAAVNLAKARAERSIKRLSA